MFIALNVAHVLTTCEELEIGDERSTQLVVMVACCDSYLLQRMEPIVGVAGGGHYKNI